MDTCRDRQHDLFGLHQLNGAIHEKLEVLNSKPFQKMDETRRSLYEQIDRPTLKPLPETRYVRSSAHPNINVSNLRTVVLARTADVDRWRYARVLNILSGNSRISAGSRVRSVNMITIILSKESKIIRAVGRIEVLFPGMRSGICSLL